MASAARAAKLAMRDPSSGSRQSQKRASGAPISEKRATPPAREGAGTAGGDAAAAAGAGAAAGAAAGGGAQCSTCQRAATAQLACAKTREAAPARAREPARQCQAGSVAPALEPQRSHASREKTA